MGLFGRSAETHVAVTPAVVSPRQTVQATVTTDKPITKVSSVGLEWGYTNFYRYHWAGGVDNANAVGHDPVWTSAQVGTNYGGQRNTEDWVGITKVELPISPEGFTGGAATFKVPSWAPGSSPLIARWSARMTVQRGGRDIDSRGDFTVVIGSQDVTAQRSPVEKVDGAGETEIDIVLPTVVYRAGETVSGHLTLTPHADLPDGDLGICLQYERASHPLVRTPSGTEDYQTDIVHLDRRMPLHDSKSVVVPFAVPVPADAAPTAAGVHSSLEWFVAVRMFYRGFNGHRTERVRVPIVVINAP